MIKSKIEILVFLIIMILLGSCQSSINEPHASPLLAVSTGASDSVKIELDNRTIYEGELIYSGILGISFFKIFDHEKVGIHTVSYMSYRHNKQAEFNFYLDDTLHVHISYNPKYHTKINFGTYNYIIYPE